MNPAQSAELHFEESASGALRLRLSGRLDARGVSALWPRAVERVEADRPTRLIIDAGQLDYMDGAGVALLFRLRGAVAGDVEIENLSPSLEALYQLYEEGEGAPPRDESLPLSLPEGVGQATVQILEDLRAEVIFVGALCAHALHFLRHPRRLRWRDVGLVAERAGVDALPIVCLIGFLIGLIMAFQSAIPMRQFGVEIFVADLVSVSMFKELGALMTGIILAGRTASAFAAELGTMKVNEEISALETMGLQPLRFLVIPRVLGVVLMAPFLSAFCTLCGLIGGAVVVLSFGYSLALYVDHAFSVVTVPIFASGLVKSLVFGVLIGSIGCLRGLQTRLDPTGVGDSTTRAVVAAIVLTVVADGIFAVLFYVLDI